MVDRPRFSLPPSEFSPASKFDARQHADGSGLHRRACTVCGGRQTRVKLVRFGVDVFPAPRLDSLRVGLAFRKGTRRLPVVECPQPRRHVTRDVRPDRTSPGDFRAGTLCKATPQERFKWLGKRQAQSAVVVIDWTQAISERIVRLLYTEHPLPFSPHRSE